MPRSPAVAADAAPARTGIRAALTSTACQGVDRLMYQALRRIFLRQELPIRSAAELERDLEDSELYLAPENLADPDRLFAAAPRPPGLVPARRREITGGSFAHYRFRTPYAPVAPRYADEYRSYDALDTVHLFAWRHARPAPASLVLLHGWGVGDRRLHEIEFNVRTLYRRLGLDVYFYVAPFHGLRRPSRARYSGELHPSVHIVRTNEAFIQTIQELRTVLGLIGAYSGAPIGVMGSSLGGYTTALLASLDDRVAFAAPIIAPASLAALFWEHGAGEPMRAKVEAFGLTEPRFVRAWSLHSPLTYTPRVPWERRLVISASDDALVTPAHVNQLWEHWGRPRRCEFTGGHILQVGRRAYVDELEVFLRGQGLLPAA